MNTLLAICQAAAEEVTFEAPNTIFGNLSADAVLLKRLAVNTCQELVQQYSWQVLKREHTITTDADVDEYPLPEDILKPIDLTFWDRTGNRPMMSTSNITWQALKSGVVVSGIRFWYHQDHNTLKLFPIPPEGTVIVFNYHSKNYCESSTGQGKNEFTSDSDVVRLDPMLIVRGIKYKFAYRKGLPYAEYKMDYIDTIESLQASDTPKGLIDVSGQPRHPHRNLPDTLYGDV